MTIVSGLRIIDSNAQTGITWWNWTYIYFYNYKRIHSAIGYMTLVQKMAELKKVAWNVSKLIGPLHFSKPYHSWERGLNENYNGLLRQFFPKRMALDNVSEKEAFRATDLMNNRPRKCLGYKTLFEVFAKMTGKDYFLNGSVALMGWIRLISIFKLRCS